MGKVTADVEERFGKYRAEKVCQLCFASPSEECMSGGADV